MAARNNKGMWLTSFQQGLAADRPTAYPGEGNLALYFATDTGALSVAGYVANEGAATWTTIPLAAAVLPSNADVSYNATHHTLVLANLPTAATGLTAGMLWNNAGVVTVV